MACMACHIMRRLIYHALMKVGLTCLARIQVIEVDHIDLDKQKSFRFFQLFQ